MGILNCLFSLIIIISYAFLAFLILHQPDIADFSTPESSLYSEYDYIVIGAGSAGSVVASRLAQNGSKVLILESGGSDEVPEIKMPITFGAILKEPRLKYLLWGNEGSRFERENYEKTIDFPRGKVVGGCGSINANLWVKGSRKIYDRWEELGAKGWRYKEIEKYYNRAERSLWIQKHGRYLHQLSRDILVEGQKLLGKTEINEKPDGFGVYETTTRNGRRWSTVDAYLKPTLRKYPNSLTLALNTTVDRVVFNMDGNRALGVILASGRQVNARKEVIVSGGTFQSPAILMRSGVGNSSELSKFGIKVVRDLPGVGEHLQDHPTASFLMRSNESKWDTIKPGPVSISKLMDYLIFGSGQYSSNIAEVGGYIKTKHGQFKNVEDVQIQCAATFFATHELERERDKHNRTEDYFGCVLSVVNGRDLGRVRLKSLDLQDPIAIEINFLRDEQDLKAMIEGHRFVQKIFQSESFKEKALNYFPSKDALEDSEMLKTHIYKSLFSMFHPVGTCKMGDIVKDEMAVVDYTLRVKGFQNLRVIDASVMPEVSNGNTYAPTVMIAEKGAHMIVSGI